MPLSKHSSQEQKPTKSGMVRLSSIFIGIISNRADRNAIPSETPTVRRKKSVSPVHKMINEIKKVAKKKAADPSRDFPETKRYFPYLIPTSAESGSAMARV